MTYTMAIADQPIKKNGAPIWFTNTTLTLFKAKGPAIGTIIFTSDMRAEMEDLTRPDSSLTMSGDIKELRFVVVKKSTLNRKQELVGECQGGNMQKKGKDVAYRATFNLEETYANPLLFSAVCMLSLIQ
jgi:hypothetical protein